MTNDDQGILQECLWLFFFLGKFPRNAMREFGAHVLSFGFFAKTFVLKRCMAGIPARGMKKRPCFTFRYSAIPHFKEQSGLTLRCFAQ